MVVKAIYLGLGIIYRIYHKGKLVFLRNRVTFQEIDTFEEPNDTLIIWGAYSANSLSDGLYLDCEPDATEMEWIYPIQDGNVLTIEQVYSATQSGNVLEVT